jgi:hypothetical protein
MLMTEEPGPVMNARERTHTGLFLCTSSYGIGGIYSGSAHTQALETMHGRKL